MAAGAELADIAGHRADQRCAPAVFRHMEVVTDAFAVVNRGGLNGPEVPRPAHDEVFR
jgi:hypothetical protein